MSTPLTSDSLAELTSAHQPPCLSLYQPTHRHHPESAQDPIRFRNLLRALEASLRQQHAPNEVRTLLELLEPLEALAQDHVFWSRSLDGLAVMAGSGIFRVFRLQRPVRELVVVANSFHTAPLRRLLQSAGRYQVLGLSLRKVQLFEGNRDTLDEVDLDPGVPRSMTEALGDVLTEPHQTVASYGGVGGAHAPMHHGHGDRRGEADKDAERYFRAIDRAVLEHHSRPSGLPLMLAALPEHHHRFRQASHNPFLLAEGLAVDPDATPRDDLRKRAWQAVEPHHHSRLTTLVDAFATAKSNGMGSDDLAQVAQAAAAGRVATLLIEADRLVAGRLDAATGGVEAADLGHPQVDDLLDDLGEMVVMRGGQVLVIPAEHMPVRTGLAATFRH